MNLTLLPVSGEGLVLFLYTKRGLYRNKESGVEVIWTKASPENINTIKSVMPFEDLENDLKA